MQRRLPVEQDHVARLQMPLHLVPVLKHAVTTLAEEAQIHALPVFLHNVPRARLARWRMRAVLHQALQALNVVRRHHLGDGKVERDAPWHAELIQAQGGVGRDHAARAEVHALPHQVAAHAALLALQALRDGLDRPPTARVAARVSGDGVVHIGHHVELQELGELCDQMGRRAGLLLPPQIVVRADDVPHHVREIVLTPGTAAHLYRRSDSKRRNWEHRQNHPIGTSLFRRQSKCYAVLVTDALEYAMHLLRCQVLPFRRCFIPLFLPLFVLHGILQAFKQDLRLVCPTTPVAWNISTGFFRFFCFGPSLADLLPVTSGQDFPQPLLLVHNLEGISIPGIALVHEELGAVETHASQNLEDRASKPRMEQRLGELNVTKVPWAFDYCAGASLTLEAAIHGAHAQIAQALVFRHTAFVRVAGLYLHHRHPHDFLWAEDTELHVIHTLVRRGREGKLLHGDRLVQTAMVYFLFPYLQPIAGRQVLSEGGRMQKTHYAVYQRWDA
mmetsp:Transcript_44451/g.74149  ORF Transcript_44451/g.74149 Transcript_44451/m.74149 type:complete len:501 (-) Transcript_44451:153-1655(-)